MKHFFSLSLELENGVFILYDSTPNGLLISYPRDITVSERLIKDSLDVLNAEPVYRDSIRNQEKWGEFYSKPLEGGGRVWIQTSTQYSYGKICSIIGKGCLKQILCGKDFTKVIKTFESNFFSTYAPDSPRADEIAIAPYRERFLKLFLEVAKSTSLKPVALQMDSRNELFDLEILQRKKVDVEIFQDGSTKLIIGQDKKTKVQVAIRETSFMTELDVQEFRKNKLNLIEAIPQLPDYVSQTFLRIPLKKFPTVAGISDFLQKLYGQYQTKKPIPNISSFEDNIPKKEKTNS